MDWDIGWTLAGFGLFLALLGTHAVRRRGGCYRIRCIVTAEQALPLGVRDRCTLGPTRHTHNVIDTGTEIDVAFPMLTSTSRIGIAGACIQGHNLGNQTVARRRAKRPVLRGLRLFTVWEFWKRSAGSQDKPGIASRNRTQDGFVWEKFTCFCYAATQALG